MKDNKLEVGDKIRVQNIYNDFISCIIRVTKTIAFGTHPTRGNDEIYKFNRDITHGVSEKPKSNYNLTYYTLIKQK